MSFIILLLSLLARVITILVIVHIVLTYVMSPYHPFRRMVDSIIEPMLDPIRRLMPNTGMVDFSPMVLIIVVELIYRILVGLLRSF